MKTTRWEHGTGSLNNFQHVARLNSDYSLSVTNTDLNNDDNIFKFV